MTIGRLAAGRVDIVEDRKAFDEGVLIRKGGRKDRERMVAISPRNVSQHLVVGAVLFDDQKNVFDERGLADVPGNSHRQSAGVNVLRPHLDIGGQVPPIVIENLFTELCQLSRVWQRNQIDGSGILMRAKTGEAA